MAIKVLITGGAGYLGSVLCEVLLKRGYVVQVVDNLLYQQHSLVHLCHEPLFTFTRADVRDEAIMKKKIAAADVIIPLAALVGASVCDRQPTMAREVNLEAVKMIERSRSKDQLVVYPTTNSGYGTKSGTIHCTEDTPLEPITLYGQTKVEAEKIILAAKNTITLRLATVFGLSARMRLDLLVNHFVYRAYYDRFIVIFEKDFKRNYVHIRDVADCFVHSIEHHSTMVGRAFNLGLDEANLSKEELALLIKRQLPDFYIHFAEIGSDPDKRNYIVSNARLAAAGFKAERSIEEGVRELIKGMAMLHSPSFGNG